MDIAPEAGLILNNTAFFVEFPGNLESGFFHGITPSCKLTRVGDPAKTNFVDNCTYIGNRRVKIFMKTDTESASNAMVYTVEVGGVPSPENAWGGHTWPVVFFVDGLTTLLVT